MEFIDRYLFEVGRHLPTKQRADILAELRSSLEDTVEARSEGEPRESDVAAVLKEMGRPREVAASYYPEGQYLIGPTLYPFFRTVLGIVLAAVIGSQLLVVGISLLLSPATFTIGEELWEILGSIPFAFGAVVLVFALLQRYGIKPEWEEEAFDPLQLPPLAGAEPINTGERIFELLISLLVLVGLTRYVYGGGFSIGERLDFLQNPVVDQYFPWLATALLLGIILDGLLLWWQRWERSTRIATILVNLFVIGVLALLVQGHSAWLAERGVTDLLAGITHLPQEADIASQLVGMIMFRLAFAIALIVEVVETVVHFYRLVRRSGGAMMPARIDLAGDV